MTEKPSVHEALRAAIGRSGMSPSEVARRAGYPRGYREIWPYMSGSRPIGPRVQERLENALGLPPGDLTDLALEPAGAAIKRYRAFLKTRDGLATTLPERAALRAVLPYLRQVDADTLRLVLLAVRYQSPQVPASATVHETHERSKP